MVSLARQTQVLRLLRCGMGTESCAVDADRVHGIQRVDRLRRQPGPAGLVGCLPGRSGDLPVYGLAEMLGQSSVVDQAKHIVVIVTSTGPRGLLVNRATQMGAVAPSVLEPLPGVTGQRSADHFRGVLKLERELVLLLDVDQLGQASSPAPACRPVPQRTVGTPSVTGGQGDTRQVILFAPSAAPAGERPILFALSIAQIAEIADGLTVCPVPGSPEHVRGLVQWRSQIVPVIDVARRLGLASGEVQGQSRLIVAQLNQGEQMVALLVQSHLSVQRLPLKCVPALRPLDVDPELVHGIVELDQETLVLPNWKRIV